MKTLTLSALFVGAALAATPALAQSNSSPADANANQSANAQTAMNGNGNNNNLSAGASVSGSISAIPNTEKKYHRSNRAADFSSEEATTKELNEAAANATTQ